MSKRTRRRTPRSADVVDDDVVERLELLYAALPVLECRGLCGHSCSAHVDASTAERARVAAVGIDLDAPTPDGSCPALSRALVPSGRCTVHEVRPMVCRLWGTAAAMPCPHGCVPAGGVVDDPRVMSWLLASLEAGGHPFVADPRMRGVLEAAQGDEVAAGLLGRFLRGDRSVAPALAGRLADLASPVPGPAA